MNDDKSLQLALNKILAHEFFQEREVYANLLKYLVEAHLNRIAPKEVTLAHEVFNKGTDYNAAEDTTVRVHMYKLREKLDEYYRGDGRDDQIKIQIPKGHYRIKIAETKKQPADSTSKNNYPIIALLVILLSAAVGYIVLDKLYLEPNHQYFEIIDPVDPVWGSFFGNSYPATVVIGDFLVFHEYHSILNRSRRIQDYEINTKAKLKT